MSKPSFTGFFNSERENVRFENNLNTNKGSLYYSQQSGFVWSDVSGDGFDISPGSLNSWITLQASSRGIVILDSAISQDGFRLKINYQIASSAQAGELGIEGLNGVV